LIDLSFFIQIVLYVLCEFDRVVEFVLGFLFAFSRLVELIFQPVDLFVAGSELEVQFGDHLLFCIQDLLK
jgi:hypothetical protein